LGCFFSTQKRRAGGSRGAGATQNKIRRAPGRKAQPPPPPPAAQQPLASLGLLIIQASRSHSRHTTLGRVPPDGWSALRRDLYLTTHTTDDTPCPRGDSNPQFQQTSGRRHTLQTPQPLGPTKDIGQINYGPGKRQSFSHDTKMPLYNTGAKPILDHNNTAINGHEWLAWMYVSRQRKKGS